MVDESEACVLEFLKSANVSNLNEEQLLTICNQLLKFPQEISKNSAGALDFLILVPLLEHESPYVSYSAKKILLNLYKSFVSQQNTGQARALLSFVVQQISRYIEQVSDYKPVNHGFLHTLDLSIALFSEKDEHDEERKNLKRFLKHHWMALFDCAFEIQDKNSTYHSLINSTLKLYIKLIKSDLQEGLHHNSTFVMAQYLLDKMKAQKVPEVCLRKTLTFLAHCCPNFDSLDSKTVQENDLCRDGVSKMLFAFVETTNSLDTNHLVDISDQLGEHPAFKGTSSGLSQWLCDLLVRRSPCHLFIGQGNMHGLGEETKSCDHLLVRTSLLVVAKCFAFLATHANSSSTVCQNECLVNSSDEEKLWNNDLSLILTTTKKLFPRNPNPYKQLINIFYDQDDAMIQFLLFSLQAALLSRKNQNLVDSHILFLQMLLVIQWNHSVMVDWLVSPETPFIQLLLKQLKSMLSKPQQWVTACHLFDEQNQDVMFARTSGHKWTNDISKGDVTFGSGVSETSTQAQNVNLTSYSDSETDDSEKENSSMSGEIGPMRGSCSFDVCEQQEVGHAAGLSQTNENPAGDANPTVSLAFIKSRNTFKSASESIKKFQSAGIFPYNPKALVRVLDRFCDANP